MSLHHVARCDRAGCTSETPLVGDYGGLLQQQQVLGGIGIGDGGSHVRYSSPIGYKLPPGWIQIDGKDLCSWACVEKVAHAKVSMASGLSAVV